MFQNQRVTITAVGGDNDRRSISRTRPGKKIEQVLKQSGVGAMGNRSADDQQVGSLDLLEYGLELWGRIAASQCKCQFRNEIGYIDEVGGLRQCSDRLFDDELDQGAGARMRRQTSGNAIPQS